MNKKHYIFVILILTFNLVSSIELISLNEKVSAGETYIGYFDGKPKVSLTNDDLKIYEGRREVYFEKGIYSYKNQTFIYVIFPKEGNFTLVTEDFMYYVEGTLNFGRINQTINIEGNSTRALQISPGIIFGSRTFTLANLGKENLKVDFQNYSYNLKVGEIRRVSANPEKDFFYIEIKSYKNFKVPAIFISIENETTSTENNTKINKTENLSIDEKKINKSIKRIEVNQTIIENNFEVNKTEVIYFLIKNLEEEEVKISLRTKMKNLNFSENISLSPLEERPVFLEYSPKETGNFEENLTIDYENDSLDISLKFYVTTKEGLEISKNLSSEDKEINSCEEINGTLCTETGYTCKGGNNVPVIGLGFCCVGGECIKIEEDKPKKSYSSYIIGVAFLLIALIAGYIIYQKYKKAKPSEPAFKK
ncbi:MAG: hypothetical protein QXX68_01165 [Candidatus Pacearchaeota archaeon]